MCAAPMKKSGAIEKACRMHRIGLIGQKPGLALFLFFVAFYYFTNAGWYIHGDEFLMVNVARQIVSRGEIGFELIEMPKYPSFDELFVKRTNGRYYVKGGLGQPMVEVPFILLHRLITSVHYTAHIWRLPGASYCTEWMFLILCPSLISALGCVLIYCFGRCLGYSEGVAMVLSLLYGLCTMAWPYSKSLMPEGTLNVAILGGVFGAVQYVIKGRWHWLTFCGACMGFAVITKATALLIVPLIVLYVVVSLRTKESLLAIFLFFAPPFSFFLGLQAYHNFLKYGSLWELGYYAGRDGLGFHTPLIVGLWGLIASPGKSFFLYAPITLLGLTCFRSFMRERRKEALLGLSICLVWTLLHACWWAWAGDWGWGPRFLLVITPYILLPCGILLERWYRLRKLQRSFLMTLILLSLWIQVLGVSVHPFSYIEVRGKALDQLMSPDMSFFTYRKWYTASAMAHFSPLFSHITGNWWLFKHMFFSYDLWADVPWRSLGDFHLNQPLWVKNGRTIPFWWPVSLPILAPRSRGWVVSLAIVNLLALIWWSLRLRRLFKSGKETNSGWSYYISSFQGGNERGE
jgi:hypothetical protein